MWLAGIGSSRVDASLGTLWCLLSVALSARWRFSPIITTATAATHYPIRSPASARPPRPTGYLTLFAYNAQLLPSPSTANPNPLSLSTADPRSSTTKLAPSLLMSFSFGGGDGPPGPHLNSNIRHSNPPDLSALSSTQHPTPTPIAPPSPKKKKDKKKKKKDKGPSHRTHKPIPGPAAYITTTTDLPSDYALTQNTVGTGSYRTPITFLDTRTSQTTTTAVTTTTGPTYSNAQLIPFKSKTWTRMCLDTRRHSVLPTDEELLKDGGEYRRVLRRNIPREMTLVHEASQVRKES